MPRIDVIADVQKLLGVGGSYLRKATDAEKRLFVMWAIISTAITMTAVVFEAGVTGWAVLLAFGACVIGVLVAGLLGHELRSRAFHPVVDTRDINRDLGWDLKAGARTSRGDLRTHDNDKQNDDNDANAESETLH